MQDVTTLPFMRIISEYGAPDYFFTEYFRVHDHSTPEKYIVQSITDNPSDRPVFAQLIGEDLFHIERTVNLLADLPIAGIDLNMGCPAPKVYKKNVGGGLLRDPDKVFELLTLLRRISPHRFTVKMRVGFDGTEHYERLLDILTEVGVDLVSIHGRTVKELYRGGVHYDLIKHACSRLPCPVFANGNLSSATRSREVLNETGADGAMIGRAAIRNPWIFRQFRELLAGDAVFQPTLGDVRGYVNKLADALTLPELHPRKVASRMKKFLNFVGQSVDEDGRFLHDMRRADTLDDMLRACDEHLVSEGRSDVLFADEPFAGLIARPNHEAPVECG